LKKHEGKNEGFAKNGYAVAYCAGHFDLEKKRYSHGVLIIDDKQQEHEICGSGMNEKYLDAQNLAGEIFGVLNAMDWAISNGFDKLLIYSQTEQIGKWLNGDEKAESRAAKMLRIIFETKYADILEIEIQTAIHLSECAKKAEELAKKALVEGKRFPVAGDNWFVIDAIETEKIKSIIKIMKSEIEALETEEIDEPNKLRYNLTFANQKLTVTLYKTSRKNLLVRGQESILFQVFVTYLNEHVEIVIEKVLSDAYRKRIDSYVLDQQVAVFIPVMPSTVAKETVRLIRQAVINLTYSKGEQYLHYGIPVLKAMEVLMKTNFSDQDIAEVFYEFKQMGKHVSNKLSGEFINDFATSKGAASKEATDTFIRNTLYELNECIVKLNLTAS
jgi:ribonuclease HI